MPLNTSLWHSNARLPPIFECGIILDVSEIVVPDNLKSGMVKSHRYDPDINANSTEASADTVFKCERNFII